MPVEQHQPPFESFFADHSGAVLGFLRGICAPADAEECAQEAFIAALRRYDEFDGASPRAWILTIARRKAIDRRRAEARRPRLIAATGDEAAPPVREQDSNPTLDRVAGLPTKQREAVVLRFLADLAYREIGEVMGTSEAAARRNVHEGITKLRDQIGVDGDGA